MFEHRLRTASIALLLGTATMSPASAAGPGGGFKLIPDAPVFKSPHVQLQVEQHAREQKDGGYLVRFWTFGRGHRHAFLLNPGESDDQAGYQAGFRFSPDSQWLVRMQKLGAGYHTLFLYHRNGYRFSPATTKPLGDLAWDYFT